MSEYIYSVYTHTHKARGIQKSIVVMQGKKNRLWNATQIKKHTPPYFVSILLVLKQ